MTLYILKPIKKKDKKPKLDEEVKNGKVDIIIDKAEHLDPNPVNEENAEIKDIKENDLTKKLGESPDGSTDLSYFVDQVKDKKDSIFKRFCDIISEKVYRISYIGLYILCVSGNYSFIHLNRCSFLGY